MFDKVRHDINSYLSTSTRKKTSILNEIPKWLTYKASIWAVLHYRFGHWAYHQCRIKPLRPLLKLFYKATHIPILFLLNIYIDVNAEIGPGLYIGHFGSIWVGPVKIGKNCKISLHNVIGTRPNTTDRALPTIGNNVYIAPGAIIAGNITIGDNARIGANTVVVRNVPAGSLAIGNPTRLIPPTQTQANTTNVNDDTNKKATPKPASSQ